MTEFFLLFLIAYETDKYKNQRMFDEAVDDSLAALKLLPNWFVTSKMIKNLYTDLYADENILYFNEDSGNLLFPVMKWVILIEILIISMLIIILVNMILIILLS